MRVGLSLLAVVGVLAACPKRSPPPPEEPEAPSELRPTVVRSWAELTPALYPEFLELSEYEIRPTLQQLTDRHDTSRWTRRESLWGPPDVPVVEFIDTDRPTTDASAISAWLVDPASPMDHEGLLPQRPLGIEPSRRVMAVVVRDFVEAPSAEDPAAVAAAIAPQFPPPWTLCTPTEVPGITILFDVNRGLKIGLSNDESKAEGAWTVDHVEFLSPGFAADAWWATKGYGECVAFAAMDAQGRVRRLRSAL